MPLSLSRDQKTQRWWGVGRWQNYMGGTGGGGGGSADDKGLSRTGPAWPCGVLGTPGGGAWGRGRMKG